MITLIQSGVLARLDEGNAQLGWVFWCTIIVFLVSWLISIVIFTAFEERSLSKYLVIGTIGPANLALLGLLIQSVL